MLSEILVLDLERQYSFAGIRGRKATTWGVLRHMFSPRFLPVVLCRVVFQGMDASSALCFCAQCRVFWNRDRYAL